jgi:hypothetical protein
MALSASTMAAAGYQSVAVITLIGAALVGGSGVAGLIADMRRGRQDAAPTPQTTTKIDPENGDIGVG